MDRLFERSALGEGSGLTDHPLEEIRKRHHRQSAAKRAAKGTLQAAAKAHQLRLHLHLHQGEVCLHISPSRERALGESDPG